MFDLKSAAIGIRKAAAIRGVWNGSVRFFGPDLENPIFITAVDSSMAEGYTWIEIKGMRR